MRFIPAAAPCPVGAVQYEVFRAHDQAAYGVAASVAEFLVSRESKATFLKFAVDGKKEGLDRALEKHYGLRGVGNLQIAWQTWAANAPAQVESTDPRLTNRLVARIKRSQ